MSREGKEDLVCWTFMLGWDKVIINFQLACDKDEDQFPPAFTVLGSCACVRRGPSWEIWSEKCNSVGTVYPEDEKISSYGI